MTVDQKLKRSRSKSEPMIKTQVSDDVSKNGIPLDGTTSTDAPSDYSLDIEASRKDVSLDQRLRAHHGSTSQTKTNGPDKPASCFYLALQ